MLGPTTSRRRALLRASIIGLLLGFVIAHLTAGALRLYDPLDRTLWWQSSWFSGDISVMRFDAIGSSSIHVSGRITPDMMNTLHRGETEGIVRHIVDAAVTTAQAPTFGLAPDVDIAVTAYGWPILSHGSAVLFRTNDPTVRSAMEDATWPGVDGARFVIDWRAVAANTGVFGALATLALLVAGGIRRGRRRARSRCIRCGHHLVDGDGALRAAPTARRTTGAGAAFGVILGPIIVIALTPAAARDSDFHELTHDGQVVRICGRSNPFGDALQWSTGPGPSRGMHPPRSWLAPPSIGSRVV